MSTLRLDSVVARHPARSPAASSARAFASPRRSRPRARLQTVPKCLLAACEDVSADEGPPRYWAAIDAERRREHCATKRVLARSPSTVSLKIRCSDHWTARNGVRGNSAKKRRRDGLSLCRPMPSRRHRCHRRRLRDADRSAPLRRPLRLERPSPCIRRCSASPARKSFKAWVPILNIVVVMQLAGLSPWLVITCVHPAFVNIAFPPPRWILRSRCTASTRTRSGLGAGMTVRSASCSFPVPGLDRRLGERPRRVGHRAVSRLPGRSRRRASAVGRRRPPAHRPCRPVPDAGLALRRHRRVPGRDRSQRIQRRPRTPPRRPRTADGLPRQTPRGACRVVTARGWLSDVPPLLSRRLIAAPVAQRGRVRHDERTTPSRCLLSRWRGLRPGCGRPESPRSPRRRCPARSTAPDLLRPISDRSAVVRLARAGLPPPPLRWRRGHLRPVRRTRGQHRRAPHALPPVMRTSPVLRLLDAPKAELRAPARFADERRRPSPRASRPVSAIAGAPDAGIPLRRGRRYPPSRHAKPEIPDEQDVFDETIIARPQRTDWTLVPPTGTPSPCRRRSSSSAGRGRQPRLPRARSWCRSTTDRVQDARQALRCATSGRWYVTGSANSTNGVLFATVMGTEVEAPAR